MRRNKNKPASRRATKPAEAPAVQPKEAITVKAQEQPQVKVAEQPTPKREEAQEEWKCPGCEIIFDNQPEWNSHVRRHAHANQLL